MLYEQAFLLNHDNYTPITRTPWAGDYINKRIKDVLDPDLEYNIGESWELSCDPNFPSQVVGYNFNLQELVEKFPEQILSKSLFEKNGQASVDILVKLLYTDQSLSLQVHPDDNSSLLNNDECGKPESWLVLDHLPGAGVYLGLKKKLRPLISCLS